MRKNYETPIFEITKFQFVDVIATSMPTQDDLIGQPGNYDDDWWTDDFL